ncbi:MAG TPA: aldo/keto reductase [Candidatus Dormibacteraeota bacterium]|nr:aldo/keto reductase [Candidatus Dormibacteraeota bacterium]
MTQIAATRQLGDSDIRVSVAGLGCNNFGMRIDAAASARVVHAALDNGVNFFDTADVYGMGRSEHHLGAALKGRRSEAIVLTKFGSPADPEHPEHRGASPEHVRRAIEASLRRLDMDYVDVYMLHRPDPATPIEATLEALTRLVEEGKVRAIASSNLAGWQVADADWVARTRGLAHFVAAENGYSLLDRAVEREVAPACRRFGQSLIPYFPLAHGLLTGKYRRGEPAPEGTRLALHPRAEQLLTDRSFDVVEGLERFAVQRGTTVLAVALGWLAAQPQVASVIAGATTPEQVAANAAATQWTPTEQDLADLDQTVRTSR